MAVIFNNSLNGIKLGDSKSNLNFDIVERDKLFLEFDSNKKLVTLSVRMIKKIKINDYIVDFANIKNFLIQQNPLVDNMFYIFPNFSLSLYIDFKSEIFLEVLLYDFSLKKEYEKDNLVRYKETLNRKQPSFINAKQMNFMPYISIGDFVFGEEEVEFKNKYNITLQGNTGVNNKVIYEVGDFVFRFDNELFTQLYIETKNINIIYNSLNINTKEGIEYIINNYHIIKNRSYYVFPELGISIWENIEERLAINFFDRRLLKFWENIYRPLTSW